MKDTPPADDLDPVLVPPPTKQRGGLVQLIAGLLVITGAGLAAWKYGRPFFEAQRDKNSVFTRDEKVAEAWMAEAGHPLVLPPQLAWAGAYREAFAEKNLLLGVAAPAGSLPDLSKFPPVAMDVRAIPAPTYFILVSKGGAADWDALTSKMAELVRQQGTDKPAAKAIWIRGIETPARITLLEKEGRTYETLLVRGPDAALLSLCPQSKRVAAPHAAVLAALFGTSPQEVSFESPAPAAPPVVVPSPVLNAVPAAKRKKATVSKKKPAARKHKPKPKPKR